MIVVNSVRTPYLCNLHAHVRPVIYELLREREREREKQGDHLH